MQRLDDLINQKVHQKGGITVFTAILVLFVLTLLMLYATRVGVFEQRISANEVRQKTAFHAAEAAIGQGIEYMLANAALILSSSVDEFPDGNGTFTRDGWFASNWWLACTSDLVGDPDHPCGGDTPMRAGSYYYDDPTTLPATVPVDSLPLALGGFANDVTARLSANICFINAGSPGGSCEPPPGDIDEENAARMIITMLGYGFSDCTDTTDVSTCSGEAAVAKPVANYKNLFGAPVVPLTTKTTFPPSGTAEVVPNPNAGGVGVPISTWANGNSSCGSGVAVTGQGSWATCELHEWYGVGEVPSGIACDQPPCSCTQEEAISYTASPNITIPGIDIVDDPAFPCDLFEFYFKVPRALYQTVKNSATVLSDCSSLGPYSSGLFWISGAECRISANTVIGSPRTPAIIVSAATTTTLVGGAEIYGVFYVFDGEDPNATLMTGGTNTIYGAAIVDATMGNYNGTFQIVYAAGVLANAAGSNGLGAVNGGWRDFGLPELAW